MRQIKYLSPSGISRFRKDQEDYYKHYISGDKRGDDEAQTQPMAIGSAFDAYAKSYIHQALFGKGNDPKYDFDNIFSAQVEEQWRDWGKMHGLYVFEIYKDSGALADLMLELTQAINIPKFEIEIMGTINSSRESKVLAIDNWSGIVFLGKPDVFYINKFGQHVILDWKVNGYCSKNKVSPMPGYIRTRYQVDYKSKSYKNGECHKDCVLGIHNGSLINLNKYLEDINIDWATQLSIYAWLSGVSIGEDFIAGIDQICCSPTGTAFPDLRIAEHRLRVRPDFQFQVFDTALDIWERCQLQPFHFFKEISIEESAARCKALDETVMSPETDQAFLDMTAIKRWR